MNPSKLPSAERQAEGPLIEALPPGSLGPGHEPSLRIAWRRRVLLMAAILACMTVFAVARNLARGLEIPAEWRPAAAGHLELVDSPLPALKDHLGSTLEGIEASDGRVLPLGALTLVPSARWIANDEARKAVVESRLEAARAVQSWRVVLMFQDQQRVEVGPQFRGYGRLGAMFWLMSTFAVVLFLVGWIVPLVQPHFRNVLYSVMAHAQALQLLLAGISSVPTLGAPVWLVMIEPVLRTVLDLVTVSAIIQVAGLHPVRLPGHRLYAAGAWFATGAYAWLASQGNVPYAWWTAQSLTLGGGLVCLALLNWTHRLQPHPFAVVMQRFCLVTLSTLALLTLAVSLMPVMPLEVQPVAAVGPVIWGVFFASIILLVPFIASSQNVMREFALLAGISTLATSVDLLFVAVFSFSQFASLTLSLFLTLGAYAAIRQWLVSQMMGARALTTERMFEHLYRIAREVEARPERAADRMIELLRNVFEPLETLRSNNQATQSRIGGNGAVLLVPLPNLMNGPMVDGSVTLRFAERGKRLFTLEDAKLADRILEQLMRALAHDRAVERGRSEERARIAQDLHDDIGARLLTLMYQSPTKEMEDYVRHTLQDLKTLTRGLAAKSHSLALAAAEWKTDIALRLEAVNCELEWHSSFDQDITLSMVQWSSLTRIVRELISNVISHAKAHQVRIECNLLEGQFTLVMQDNGVGRNPQRWAHGLGLGGIRKRVKLMGGTVAWSEQEPAGIVCTVLIPRLVGQGA